MMKRTLMLSGLLTAAAWLPASAQSRGPTFEGEGGKVVFERVCAACHMSAGVGVPGAYPPMANNPKMAGAPFPIAVVLNGDNAMPALSGMLSDQQISDVVNYVRSTLNPYTPSTTPADIKALRTRETP